MIELLQNGMKIGITAIGAMLTACVGIVAVVFLLAIIAGIIRGIAGLKEMAGGVSDRGVCFDDEQKRKESDDAE